MPSHDLWKSAYFKCDALEKVFGEAVKFIYDIRSPADEFSALSGWLSSHSQSLFAAGTRSASHALLLLSRRVPQQGGGSQGTQRRRDQMGAAGWRQAGQPREPTIVAADLGDKRCTLGFVSRR